MPPFLISYPHSQSILGQNCNGGMHRVCILTVHTPAVHFGKCHHLQGQSQHWHSWMLPCWKGAHGIWLWHVEKSWVLCPCSAMKKKLCRGGVAVMQFCAFPGESAVETLKAVSFLKWFAGISPWHWDLSYTLIWSSIILIVPGVVQDRSSLSGFGWEPLGSTGLFFCCLAAWLNCWEFSCLSSWVLVHDLCFEGCQEAWILEPACFMLFFFFILILNK